jgi:two-component system chemotaxis response regulator CheB
MEAIRHLLGRLGSIENASVCIVSHLSPDVDASYFISSLQKNTRMPCHLGADNMPLESGNVYLAPANYHFIIKEKTILLGGGPVDHRWRPSIDVAFRSAAISWDTHCIGIILSGMLNDGVAGMNAIRTCGGLTIVQDVFEAAYPDMPKAVLGAKAAQYAVPLDAMPAVIENYMGGGWPRRPAPQKLQEEARRAEEVASGKTKDS